METPHLVYAPIDISFVEFNTQSESEKEDIYREFHKLSESDNDSIGQWLKLKKAKGETQDSDQIILEVLVNLHRRLDKIEKLIKDESEELLNLNFEGQIEKIGFSHFQLKKEFLTKDKNYYGRISIKTYPERDVPVFFKAIDSKLAIITKIHTQDENEWNAYFRARERVMIREKNNRQ